MKAGLGLTLSARIGIVMIGAFMLAGIFGPWLAPYDPEYGDLEARFLAQSTVH